MYASSVKRCVVMSNVGTMLEGPRAMECLVIFCLESSIYDGGASSARGANWRGSSASLAPPKPPIGQVLSQTLRRTNEGRTSV